MSLLTRTLVRPTEPKPARPVYLGWLVAILTLQLTLYFFVAVVTAVDREWGVLGVILGAALFPVTLVVMPLYAGLAHGQWVLVGLMAASFVLLSLFRFLDRPSPRYATSGLSEREMTQTRRRGDPAPPVRES